MSSQNTFPGANGVRPVPRPTNQERPRQPSWVNPQVQGGRSPQQGANWQQPVPGQPGAFEQPDFGAPSPETDYGHWGQLQTGGRAGQPAAGQAPADPYAPHFEPYTPTRPAYGRQQPINGQAGQSPPQWPGHAADPQGFDAFPTAPRTHAPQVPPQFSHGASSLDPAYPEPSLGQPDWRQQPDLGGFDDDGYGQPQGGAELGFAQPEGGELDPAYGEEDLEEYEDDYPPRSRRPMMIAAALVGAILVGGGMAYGYKNITAADTDGEPPVIKSEASPSKTRPAEAGGKQFPYSNTKIMGRLGDGTPPASAAESHDSASSDASPSPNERGPRKVETLVVGRDGTIQPPQPEAPSAAAVSVPGTSLVNVFGSAGSRADDRGPGAAAASKENHEAAAESPPPKSITASEDDDAPPVKPVKIATVHPATSKPAAGRSRERDDAAAPQTARAPKKVARAETTATDANPEPAPITSSSGSSGYVAVLASVPESPSSRIDALKRFADLQQKYSAALAGKTPDVAEADLGSRGKFHRLIVGPPGSRQQASAVCSDLKAQGYSSCWITTY